MAHTLADLYEHAADAFGDDRLAVVEGGRRLTFADLEAEANRWADALRGLGAGAGGHIGIQMRNGVDCIAAYIGVLKLRAVPISINYRYSGGELDYLLDYSDADIVIVHARFAAATVESAEQVTTMRHVVVVAESDDDPVRPAGTLAAGELLSAASRERAEIQRSADDAYLVFTGGTTGRPKGVMWRQEDLWRSLGGGSDYHTLEPVTDEHAQAAAGLEGDPTRNLILLPLIHTSGLMPTFTLLFGGGTCYFMPQFDARDVWRLIDEESIQVCVLAGDAMARPMVGELRRGEHDASSLFMVSSGAALFSPTMKKDLLERLPDLMIMDAFGSSESGFGGLGMVTKADVDSGALFEHHGPRIPRGQTLYLVDDHDEILPDDSRETGWIVKTGYLPSGYYKDPVKSAETFRDTALGRVVFTGDRGIYDGPDTIIMLGRASQVINSGGEKIFSEEVEVALRAAGGIEDAVVLGVPDERFGTRVGAIIQTGTGSPPDFEVLEGDLRRQLAGFKVPVAYWVVDEVERHPSSKTDFSWARALVAELPATRDRRESGSPVAEA